MSLQIKSFSHRHAIVTKYSGPTNSRDARVVARSTALTYSHSYDHRLNIDENHHAAAVALAKKIGWNGGIVAGIIPGGSENVYILETE
jgi:hypothetical protein